MADEHEPAVGAIEVRCAACGGYHAARPEPAFDELLRTACVDVNASSQELYRAFRMLEPGGRWGVDAEGGLIAWTHADGSVAHADYQFAGSWIETTGSWLWGWDHPHRTEANTAALRAVRDHGEAHDLEVLTTPYLIVSDRDAWHLTNIAAHLIGWPGAYRAKVNEKAWSFFAFSQPRWDA